MKKFGLVGGVGYLATLDYYKNINEGFKARLENPPKSGSNPPIVIESINIADAYNFVQQKNWKDFAKLFSDAVCRLHGAGAEFAAIAANTAHIVFDDIQDASPIPLIGIVDETCKRAKEQGIKKMIIFGTDFTMSSGMYEEKCKQFDIEAISPNEIDRKIIHDIIFPNLESGIVLEHEKEMLLSIAKKMQKEHHADALVLGCTELPFAIKKGDLEITLLDTGAIHIDAILDMLLR